MAHLFQILRVSSQLKCYHLHFQHVSSHVLYCIFSPTAYAHTNYKHYWFGRSFSSSFLLQMTNGTPPLHFFCFKLSKLNFLSTCAPKPPSTRRPVVDVIIVRCFHFISSLEVLYILSSYPCRPPLFSSSFTKPSILSFPR